MTSTYHAARDVVVNNITNNFNSCSQHVCKRALENNRDQTPEKVQIPLPGLGEGNDPVTVGGKEASRCNLPADSGHMPARPGTTDGTIPGQIQASTSEQEGVTSRGPVWKWKQGPGDPYSVDKYSNKATTLLRVFDGQKEIPAISVSRTLAARIEEAIDTGRDYDDIVADLSKVSDEIETRLSHQHEVRPQTMATSDKIDGHSLRHRKLDELIEQKSQLQRDAKQAEEKWKNFCSKALLVLDDVWVKAGIAQPKPTKQPNKVAQTNRIPEKSMEGMLSSSKAKDPSASTEPNPLLHRQYDSNTPAAPSTGTTETVMRAETQPELLRKSSELSVSSPVTSPSTTMLEIQTPGRVRRRSVKRAKQALEPSFPEHQGHLRSSPRTVKVLRESEDEESRRIAGDASAQSSTFRIAEVRRLLAAQRADTVLEDSSVATGKGKFRVGIKRSRDGNNPEGKAQSPSKRSRFE